MRLVIQRVLQAEVQVNENTVGNFDGFTIYAVCKLQEGKQTKFY